MNPLERRVLDAIDIEGMLGFLGRLVEIRSLCGDETTAQQLVAAQMERAGLEVDRWPIDLEALRQHPAHCEEVDRQQALGVVGRFGGNRTTRSLILNGHVDVVPVGDPDRWQYPPWRATFTDRRVYGRGTADMKGGLCCALYAVKALRDAGVALVGPVLVHSVVGEEDGGTGTLASLLRGHSASAAIIMEPTDLDVVTAQAGALNFRLSVHGRAAHGSMPGEGISAIERFVPLLEALRELEAARNRQITHPLMAELDLPYPISIGTLRAGDWASSVPELLVCEGRYGVAIDESTESARLAFEEAVRGAAAADPWLAENSPRIEWWGGQFDPAETATDAAIVGTVRAAVRSLTGVEPHLRGVPYGADMRLLTRVGGIPTILFGPGDVRRAHQTDEFVPIDDLILATRALSLVVLRYCGIVES